jgi:hypothetical protein
LCPQLCYGSGSGRPAMPASGPQQHFTGRRQEIRAIGSRIWPQGRSDRLVNVAFIEVIKAMVGGYGQLLQCLGGAVRSQAERRFRARPLRHLQKRKGDFSRETSPPHFRLSEIRFGFQITTLVTPESFGTREL